MQKYIDYLKGRKSYIIAGLTLVYGFLQTNNIHNWRAFVPYVLASGYGAAIRAAIAKNAVK